MAIICGFLPPILDPEDSADAAIISNSFPNPPNGSFGFFVGAAPAVVLDGGAGFDGIIGGIGIVMMAGRLLLDEDVEDVDREEGRDDVARVVEVCEVSTGFVSPVDSLTEGDARVVVGSAVADWRKVEGE